MSFELAKMYRVDGPLDRATIDEDSEITVHFNPASLKVSLANSIKENERDQSSRAAQFIEKSSSVLTVELIFDTTDMFMSMETGEGDQAQTSHYDFDVRADIREIAHTFLYSDDVGEENVQAQRCLFVWGAFLFVGIMESLEETIEFFSPEGVPLRAAVSIKLNESRFIYGNREAGATQKSTPSLSSAPTPDQASQSSRSGGKNTSASSSQSSQQDPRAVAMYNGAESPRSPLGDGAAVALPSSKALDDLKASGAAGTSLNAGAGGGFSAGLGAAAGVGVGGGFSAAASAAASAGASAGASTAASFSAGAGFNASASLNAGGASSLGVSFSASSDASGGFGAAGSIASNNLAGLSANVNLTPPAFSFGASSRLGTSIPGAFSTDFKKPGGLCAGALAGGSVALREQNGTTSLASASASATVVGSANASSSTVAKANARAQLGFD